MSPLLSPTSPPVMLVPVTEPRAALFVTVPLLSPTRPPVALAPVTVTSAVHLSMALAMEKSVSLSDLPSLQPTRPPVCSLPETVPLTVQLPMRFALPFARFSLSSSACA